MTRIKTEKQTQGSTWVDRKSTRLNSSHDQISYAVFCLKKKMDKSELQPLRELGGHHLPETEALQLRVLSLTSDQLRISTKHRMIAQQLTLVLIQERAVQ